MSAEDYRAEYRACYDELRSLGCKRAAAVRGELWLKVHGGRGYDYPRTATWRLLVLLAFVGWRGKWSRRDLALLADALTELARRGIVPDAGATVVAWDRLECKWLTRRGAQPRSLVEVWALGSLFELVDARR